MGKKYFALSYDDGLEQDKVLIKLLKKYGLKCTFNLNAGLLGKCGSIGRIGEYGVITSKKASKKNGFICKYVPFNRIPEDEIGEVYKDFEVASHAYKHERITNLNDERLQYAISEDVKMLSEIVGYQVKGFAYPFGSENDSVAHVLKSNGICYGRGVISSGNFQLPKDPMHMQPTCWHGQKNVFDLLNYFFEMDVDEDLIFVMWGHAYEFDYGTKLNSWERIERILSLVSEQEDIVSCTMIEAVSKICHRKLT